MFLVYKNYEISSIEYQGTDCFQVKTPENKKWDDLAASVSTAKNCADCDGECRIEWKEETTEKGN